MLPQELSAVDESQGQHLNGRHAFTRRNVICDVTHGQRGLAYADAHASQPPAKSAVQNLAHMPPLGNARGHVNDRTPSVNVGNIYL